MNYQQIVSRINDMYPHGETTATVLNHINGAQDELSFFFGKMITDSSLVTVADQAEYAFPALLTDVSEIKRLEIGTSGTPVDNFDYTQYKFVEMDLGRPSGNSFYQIYSSVGAKSLGIYPIPQDAGFPIRITFRKKLTDATSSTMLSEPEFDSRYHDLLIYFACHMICSSGASPDSVQANSFLQKYNEGVDSLWRLKSEQAIVNPTKKRDNSFWYR